MSVVRNEKHQLAFAAHSKSSLSSASSGWFEGPLLVTIFLRSLAESKAEGYHIL